MGSAVNKAIDEANARFWDELCGTSLAKYLGITDRSESSLRKFDDYYLTYYPYLLQHVPAAEMRGENVLEIGLGFGTLSQQIAQSGAIYNGLDIAKGPVDMVNERLRMIGAPGRAVQGSMLACPFPDNSMDRLVSIGCFHHTGNTQRCIEETFRVLKPGGRAHIMVYNRFSYRQWLRWPKETALAVLGRETVNQAQRHAYDSDSSGDAAPETQFFSKGQLRKMFSKFAHFSAQAENSEDLIFRGRVQVSREKLLPIVGPVLGLDVYVTAQK